MPIWHNDSPDSGRVPNSSWLHRQCMGLDGQLEEGWSSLPNRLQKQSLFQLGPKIFWGKANLQDCDKLFRKCSSELCKLHRSEWRSLRAMH